jgi:hypothetical protein
LVLPFVAFRINSAISSGCVTSDAWLELRDIVVAFIRFAKLRLLTEGGDTLEGNFTSANLLKRLARKQMSDLVNMINDGIVYVRVQTVDNPLLGEMGGKVQPAPQ